ncbi:fec operon regulator FecR [compost metagenome]
MPLPHPPRVPPQVAEQAVRWLVELQGGPHDERLRQDWQRWRQAAPEHEQAWKHIEAVNRRLDGIATPLARAALERRLRHRRRRQPHPAEQRQRAGIQWPPAAEGVLPVSR